MVDGVVVQPVARPSNDRRRRTSSGAPTRSPSPRRRRRRRTGCPARSGELSSRDEHQRPVGVLQDAVDDRRRSSASTSASGRGSAVARRTSVRPGRPGRARTAAARTDANGEATAATLRWVSTVTSLIPSADSAAHRAARGGAEADHRGPQPAAVVAGRPAQLQRVQDRAVAGQLVVLVEDVDAEGARRGSSGSSPPRRSASGRGRSPTCVIARPARSAASPTRPARGAASRRSSASGLGSTIDVAPREQLLARQQPADQRRQLVVGDAEPLAVPALEEEPPAHARVDALDVRRVDRQPPLVRLARRRDDAGSQVAHRASLEASMHHRPLLRRGEEPTPPPTSGVLTVVEAATGQARRPLPRGPRSDRGRRHRACPVLGDHRRGRAASRRARPREPARPRGARGADR